MNVRLSTARTVMVGPVLDADGVAKTNLARAAILVSKDGADPAALDGSATLTHKQTGHYLLAYTANDASALGVMEFSINSTTDAMPIKSVNSMATLTPTGTHSFPASPLTPSVGPSNRTPTTRRTLHAPSVSRTGAHGDVTFTASRYGK